MIPFSNVTRHPYVHADFAFNRQPTNCISTCLDPGWALFVEQGLHITGVILERTIFQTVLEVKISKCYKHKYSLGPDSQGVESHFWLPGTKPEFWQLFCKYGTKVIVKYPANTCFLNISFWCVGAIFLTSTALLQQTLSADCK